MTNTRFLALLLLLITLAGCGGGGNSSTPPPPEPTPAPTPEPPGLNTGPEACVNGSAGDFACSGVDLRSRVPLEDMEGITGNDLWGWVDPRNGDEYALMGMTNGTAFINVTDPEAPVFMGILPTQTTGSTWRDIKVSDDHAFIVADAAGAHGMQVFDLTRLRDLSAPETFAADVVYGEFQNAHNLAINEASGFAYAVGTNTCGEGLHMIDISTPLNPLFAGCHSAIDTHDAQCVDYIGPDADHAGKEICFSAANLHDPDANATTDGVARLEIADVTTKSSPVQISLSAYPESVFSHQGWLTENHQFFLLGDELDEQDRGVPTRTHVFDVTDLDAPVHLFAYEAPTPSIDHNLYVLGNRVFHANYTTGLRVVEFADLANGQVDEIAFFDTFPEDDDVDFKGAWSVYPYLPSGNLLVSDRSNGLFVLRLADAANAGERIRPHPTLI
ncbi:MAG: choice-of-anchor B family protein [Gammaproteobacteria bacterium]|nr:choice-of-anchor B family protein [Gammaproteobacteria bacterium]